MVEYTTLGNLITPAKVIRCGTGNYPVLSMTMHDGIVLQSERFKKSLASTDQKDYKVVKRGQLVVGFPIDEGVLYVQKAVDEGIMSPAYNVWEIDTEQIDPDFLELCLHSPQSMKYYKDKLRGTTARRRSIPTADLLALPICKPDFSLQHEAVEILKKVNRLIEAQQQQASYLDELVKSRFIELFGDPVSNPKRWSVCALEECLVSIENGKSFVCSNEARQGILPAVLKLSAATYGEYHPEENKAVLDAEMFVTSAEVHAGDLLFTRKNTPELVGMCTYVWETPPALMMPDLIFRLNTNSKCRKIYLWKLINHDSFRSQIQAIAGGSAKSMSNISKERLGRLPIMLPPISIQDQFATFVEQVDKSKLAVQKGLEELEILKKSLMQQYFG